jgi:hypothetical protein
MAANQRWLDLTSTDMLWNYKNVTSLKDGHAGTICRPTVLFSMMSGARF